MSQSGQNVLIATLRLVHDERTYLVGFLSNFDGHLHFPRTLRTSSSDVWEESMAFLSASLYASLTVSSLRRMPFQVIQMGEGHFAYFDIALESLVKLAEVLPNNSRRSKELRRGNAMELCVPIPIDSREYVECPACLEISSDEIAQSLCVPSTRTLEPFVTWYSGTCPLLDNFTRTSGLSFVKSSSRKSPKPEKRK